MSTGETFAIALNSAEATEAFGARLGRELRGGDLLLLSGGLGAGKTTFVRGLLRGLDFPDPREAASPTFAIHHRYEGGRCPINHLDLYRLEDPLAAARQGLLDPLDDAQAVTAIEWSERLPNLAQPALRLAFRVTSEDTRELRIDLRAFGRSLSSDLRLVFE